ncbi:CbtA family protein [Frankia sp. Cr2]|uniref:CbtA family protein n=1 Tax=Frankia sp. Cr2 TaxID=3073932 RepID=UPI002AD52C2B|nr:CbtA family protein [Frankia sp. Cr2]
MVRALLTRGMLVGALAALCAFVVAKVLGESQVGHAIAFESARDAAEGVHGTELVSRTVQSTIGLFTGLLVFGVAIGGLFALAYAGVQGRLGGLGARGTAAFVALAGFVGMYLLPDLKYPANPPSIGNSDTIGERTSLYFTMMLISLAVVIGGAVTARRLAARFGAWDAALLAMAGGLVVVGLAYYLLPPVHETPQGFPADVLWRFRIASLAIQVSLWTTIGLLFGALTDRAVRSARSDQKTSSAVAPTAA